MVEHRLVIAGTGSGVGKTTLTIGIMAALRKRGYTVQGFKCGPDYIDPTYHTAVTGRTSRNLDSWMVNQEQMIEIFQSGSKNADISIIEGVMGFYDGKDPLTNQGSTAEISVITKSPVILIVNCASMARSAAAVVKGFQMLSNEPNIVGVIANRVGSEGHYKIVKMAIEQECNIPVIGYMKREAEIEIPERHLGLIPSIERGELDGFFETLGSLVEETIDIEALYQLSEAPSLPLSKKSIFTENLKPVVKIAIARDAAFNFYYQENLELLEAYGAELIFFSPLKGDILPQNVDGLYIGGGFPEEFAEELSKNSDTNQSIKDAIMNGLPTVAECGGFMYLTEAIELRDRIAHPMLNIVPGRVTMQQKLAALGYRTITGMEQNYLIKKGEIVKGHEFHFSTFKTNETINHAYETQGMAGTKKEGFLYKNLVAGYSHLYFPSYPTLVQNWISKCMEWRETRNKIETM